MDNKDVGNNMRRYRKSRNLSLKRLGELASVTSSLLSQIERGLANPSINTLRIVSKVLDIPLFSFFMEPPARKNLILKPKDRTIMSFPKNKDISYELLAPDLNGVIEFGILHLTPNSKNSESPQENKYELLCYMLKGKTQLLINGELFLFDTYDSVRIDPFTKYQIINNSNEPAEMIFADPQHIVL